MKYIKKYKEGVQTYKVKKSEGVWRIAKNLGVPMEDLIKENGIENNLVYEGQELVIPKKKELVIPKKKEQVKASPPPLIKEPVQMPYVEPKDNIKTTIISDIKAKRSKVKRSSLSTRLIRNTLKTVLPENVSQLIASMVTKDPVFGTQDAESSTKRALYYSILNNSKKHSNNKGGTEYIDFGKEMHSAIQTLKGSPIDIITASRKSPDFNAATTFGRVSYKYIPEEDLYEIYDRYDFSKTKEFDTSYSKFRNRVGNLAESRNLSPKKEAILIGRVSREDMERAVADFQPNFKKIIEKNSKIKEFILNENI